MCVAPLPFSGCSNFRWAAGESYCVEWMNQQCAEHLYSLTTSSLAACFPPWCLQRAFASNNFVRFFALVRQAPYLLACLSHIYFGQVCAMPIHRWCCCLPANGCVATCFLTTCAHHASGRIVASCHHVMQLM